MEKNQVFDLNQTNPVPESWRALDQGRQSHDTHKVHGCLGAHAVAIYSDACKLLNICMHQIYCVVQGLGKLKRKGNLDSETYMNKITIQFLFAHSLVKRWRNSMVMDLIVGFNLFRNQGGLIGLWIDNRG